MSLKYFHIIAINVKFKYALLILCTVHLMEVIYNILIQKH